MKEINLVFMALVDILRMEDMEIYQVLMGYLHLIKYGDFSLKLTKALLKNPKIIGLIQRIHFQIKPLNLTVRSLKVVETILDFLEILNIGIHTYFIEQFPLDIEQMLVLSQELIENGQQFIMVIKVFLKKNTYKSLAQD